MEKKYLYLKDYAKELKANLKIHKGETIIKGSEIESQFKTYSKLQRLFKHVDKRDVKEYEKHIDSFYKKIEDKRKLEVKDHIEKVIVEEKKVNEVILSSDHQEEEPKNEEKEEEEDEEEEVDITEVGPTPQLNGRVLSLFDIVTSPDKTPKRHFGNSSRKLSFSESEANDSNEVNEITILNKINETPRYLRTQADRLRGVGVVMDNRIIDENIVDSKFEEPSPILKRHGRSIFDIRKDLVGLKRNLTDLMEEAQEEEEMKIKNGDEVKKQGEVEGSEDDVGGIEKNDGDVGEVYDPHAKLRAKIKTNKRQTRRAKLKTDNINDNDELDSMDIHALAFGDIKSTEKNENMKRINDDDDDDEEEGDSDEYERRDIEELKIELGNATSKGKHPLSNNFVRLKINKRGRFKRRH